MAQQQLLISVVNHAQIHAFGKTELARAKTDKADARLIARYCRMHRPAPWVPPIDVRSSSFKLWYSAWNTFWRCRTWRATAWNPPKA
ncbi:IS110 family transposase [Acidithiobacillus ferrianus]|uniref:IS110 family transposase n=1 Tax=Acidithiobacillus ferrianus TaxID=2678518 RepID=UPI0034E5AD26